MQQYRLVLYEWLNWVTTMLEIVMITFNRGNKVFFPLLKFIKLNFEFSNIYLSNGFQNMNALV